MGQVKMKGGSSLSHPVSSPQRPRRVSTDNILTECASTMELSTPRAGTGLAT